MWARHRQSSASERTQLRWLLWAGIMCVLMVLAAVTLSVGGVVTTVLLDLAVASLAVSVAVGLVRPGLGDVDALVAWTLTTAVVAAIVVGIDLAVLAAGTALLGDRLDQRDVTLVVLVLAVVVYGPLRGWLGGLVHRLLLGRRNDRYGAVSALAARLETIGTVDEQLPALASAVADTFKVRHVRVEVLTPDGGLLSASHGTPPAEVQEIDIAYQDERVGRLVLPVQGYRSMLSRRDQGLLVDLVRQAAVAIRARLLATELQASRERLVLGREDDRRRIRRDLHDGLGPALGGVALRLQAAGNAIDTDPARAHELVALARTEVSDALDDVRRLVHDLRPPALDDLGLEAAVRQQADRVRSEVDVDVDGRRRDGSAGGRGGRGLPDRVGGARQRGEARRRPPRRRTPRGRRGRADRHRRGRRPRHRARRHRRGRPAVVARARRGARRPLRGRCARSPAAPPSALSCRTAPPRATPSPQPEPRPPRRACARPNP